MLGQAGKDAGATYINSIGGKVVGRVDNPSAYKVPLFEMVSAGGNNEWAVPMTADGRDVAEVLRNDPVIRKNLSDKLKKSKVNATAEKEKLLNSMASDKKEKILALVQEYESTRNYKAKENVFWRLKNSAPKVANAIADEEMYEKRIGALEKKLDYRDGTQAYGVSTENAIDLLSDNPEKAEGLMVFTEGGPEKNGLLFPEQIGGQELDTMIGADGKSTRSIKGLRIPYLEEGKTKYLIAPDVVFVGAPHPTYLSMNRSRAAQLVEDQLLKPLLKEMDRGWKPPTAEPGRVSSFPNKPYSYGRALIPESHGDPFMPRFRLTPVSEAVRESDGITTGTRNKIERVLSKEEAEAFRDKIYEMKKAKPSNPDLLSSHEVLTSRPRNDEWLFKYDRGPSDDYYKLMVSSINERELFWPKNAYQSEAAKELKTQESRILKENNGKALTAADKEEALVKTMDKIFDKYGIKAFNVKTHPNNGPYSHYRGTFENPKVIILADPHGFDDFATSKALTGSRGQYLNGLMQDLGVEDKYLVIKTVPVEMDGATKEEWEAVLKSTKEYRQKLFAKLLADNPDAVIVTDGQYAAEEMKGLTDKKFTSIKRGNSDDAGIKAAGRKLAKLDQFSGRTIHAERIDIPREHLTFIARTWEGTSGDRVIMGGGKEAGKNFHIVRPDWAVNNDVILRDSTRDALDEMIEMLVKAGEPRPRERVGEFISRRMDENPYFMKKFQNCIDLLKKY